MDEVAILRALQHGVTAAVAASGTPALPLSYVDVGFDTPDDQKYLEIVWIPNNLQGDFWGHEKNYRGIMRLVLHWPVNGAGAYGPLGTLGSIADYFSKGRMLDGTVQIYEAADFTGKIDQGEETLYSVSIRYTSYRP